MLSRWSSNFSGSSPRVWGIRLLNEPNLEQHRFIPTRVGNTDNPSTQKAVKPVHPHACGEYARHPKVPPRASRFIPTRVGNTTETSAPSGVLTVHPHACGEYFWSRAINAARRGSSPRVWGILVQSRLKLGGNRFIPTRVGNTTLMSMTLNSEPVHPHACGEYTNTVSGSTIYPRFIPTRVGNTCISSSHPIPRSVHPHACGEYRFA